MSKIDKINTILSMELWRDKSIVELKPRSGKLPPKMTEFGMSLEGYGNVCVLADLNVDELLDLRDYVDRKIKERVK